MADPNVKKDSTDHAPDPVVEDIDHASDPVVQDAEVDQETSTVAKLTVEATKDECPTNGSEVAVV